MSPQNKQAAEQHPVGPRWNISVSVRKEEFRDRRWVIQKRGVQKIKINARSATVNGVGWIHTPAADALGRTGGFAGFSQHSIPGSHDQQLLMETTLALPCSRALFAWVSQAQLVSIKTLPSVSFPVFVLYTAQRRGQPVRRFKQQLF